MANHYNEFWPELAEREDIRYIPPWHTLEAQNVAVRHALREQVIESAVTHIPVQLNTNPHRRKYGTVPDFVSPDDFDLHNIHAFQYLPAIAEMRDKFAHLSASAVVRHQPGIKRDAIYDQVRNELAFTMYHHAMWRRYGRRVYVLDETTYTLLAETPLPDLPASILAAPEHSFYLVFPRNVFSFGVWNTVEQREDLQPVEGVMVAMDNIDPDSPKPRELSFINVGAGNSVDDRNIAFISVALGPDAKLSDVRFQNAVDWDPSLVHGSLTLLPNGKTRDPNEDYAEGILSGAFHLGVITPRVILGFLLYLQSEHPDIEPVPPPARRAFKEVRSPKQREAALRNQAEKLRGVTRLPILYVGRHLAEEIAVERRALAEIEFSRPASGTAPGHTLDHPVWVRGHWRRQPHGKGNLLRKMIWIRPFLKGPDFGDSIKTHAVKVQQAQAAGESPQVSVTPVSSRVMNRMKHTGTE